ncbi:hypothetical protein Val02_13350 [Virgisporangium aliadipatigenens]|uniref:Actin-binding WH2 domain-containing protein n=1 Tax=Virgisporangium aliadipatigenens TaxID=741659 RepID=A0A8J3YFX4_9ACTN|nr:hypothetical protein [Virgisporangium aliadipatigenens]GIJ44449.1 hypothetical protein Val02_13350 [Virgisporangium aliadipatigenens]
MAASSGLLVIERILRDRDGVWEQIGEERDLGKLSLQMLGSSVAALACYGAVLGASNTRNAALQALVSSVKLPLLFLVTLAICLPTLYLFNLVFGAKLQVKQALALVLVAITVISTLSFAFAPISLFFLITANHYQFFKLLNVGILTLTALVGLRFLTGGMASLNRYNALRTVPATPVNGTSAAVAQKPVEQPVHALPSGEAAAAEGVDALDGMLAAPAPAARPAASTPALQRALTTPDRPVPANAIPQWSVAPRSPHQVESPDGSSSMTLLYVWILLFGFVGTQLAWTLRPFFGSPDQKFELFRSIDGNFYVDIVRTFGHLF